MSAVISLCHIQGLASKIVCFPINIMLMWRIILEPCEVEAIEYSRNFTIYYWDYPTFYGQWINLKYTCQKLIMPRSYLLHYINENSLIIIKLWPRIGTLIRWHLSEFELIFIYAATITKAYDDYSPYTLILFNNNCIACSKSC